MSLSSPFIRSFLIIPRLPRALYTTSTYPIDPIIPFLYPKTADTRSPNNQNATPHDLPPNPPRFHRLFIS
ncbi:hypothetical protein BDW66DRAFT_133326 [Aspergillus desertorum]